MNRFGKLFVRGLSSELIMKCALVCRSLDGESLVSRQDFKHVLVAPGVALSETVFDRVRFAQSTMDDIALQCEVIGLFRAQVAETKERIKLGSISSQDRKFLSHNLRGAAAAIGALQIEELAKTWENVSFDAAVLEALLDQAETAFIVETRAFHS